MPSTQPVQFHTFSKGYYTIYKCFFIARGIAFYLISLKNTRKTRWVFLRLPWVHFDPDITSFIFIFSSFRERLVPCRDVGPGVNLSVCLFRPLVTPGGGGLRPLHVPHALVKVHRQGATPPCLTAQALCQQKEPEQKLPIPLLSPTSCSACSMYSQTQGIELTPASTPLMPSRLQTKHWAFGQLAVPTD